MNMYTATIRMLSSSIDGKVRLFIMAKDENAARQEALRIGQLGLAKMHIETVPLNGQLTVEMLTVEKMNQ